MNADPTAPLSERSPEQVSAFVDDHLLAAIDGANHLLDPDLVEDYIRDRLVALVDTYPTPAAVAAETHRRRVDRLRRVFKPLTEETPHTETLVWCTTRNGYADESFCKPGDDHVHYDVDVEYPSGKVLTGPAEQARRRAEAERAHQS